MVASISWVTNQWAPYRRPVWDHMAKHLPLTVNLLEADPGESENRGKDWVLGDEVSANYTVRVPRNIRIRSGEAPLSVLMAPWNIVRSARVLVLGGWEDLSYWQLLLLARLWGRRTVGFYASTNLTNRHRGGVVAAARRLYFRSLDAVVSVGTASTEALLSFGVKPERIFQGFNSVDVKAAHQAADQARAEVGRAEVPGEKLIYVGQLIERKNVDGLLAALAQLTPEFTLSIVGRGSQDDQLKKLVSAYGIADRVEFLGYRAAETVPALLSEHATLVLPSTEEVWGLVVNEALACGLHVVVSRVCGVAGSVADMPGVFVSDTSPDGLANQIRNSAAAWQGPIAQPEILAYTPEVFAETFLRASAPEIISDRSSSSTPV